MPYFERAAARRPSTRVKVELFYTEGCERCAASRESLQAAVLNAVPDVLWREVNALEEMDYAVEVGVLALPAVAIDGKLVFSSLPSPAQLSKAVRERRGASHGRR